jgi:hypothetical protein
METYNGKVYWIFHSFILIHDSGDCTKSIRVKVYQTVDTCVAMQVVHMNGIAYLMIKGHKILYLYNLADVLSKYVVLLLVNKIVRMEQDPVELILFHSTMQVFMITLSTQKTITFYF